MSKQHRICEVCRKPQFSCSSGWVCENGHGGAPYYLGDVPDYDAQYGMWYRKIKAEIREAHNDALRGMGVPEDDLHPEPQCKKCQDTGIVYGWENGLARKLTCTACDAVTKNQKRDIVRSAGEYVWEIAEMCFQDCPDDFCVQDDAGEVIVFGGTNRLVWSAFKGFSIDESYCTGRFIKKAKEVLGIRVFPRRQLGDPAPYEF